MVSWPRATRLDAAPIVDALHRIAGVRLTIERRLAGGETGAAQVRWPDGHAGVLSWRPGISAAELRRGPLAVLGALSAVSYPAPGVEFVADVEGGVATVTELLPGSAIEHVDADMLDQLLVIHRLHQDRLMAPTAVPLVRLHLRADGPGYCLHEPLRRYGARTVLLEQWVRRVGALFGEVLEGHDAVHYDFQPGNMLRDEDHALTGVVDWDGAGRGDSRLDLVTLRFGLHAANSDARAIERLDAILEQIPGDVLLPAWAHMSLRMVDWSIRHHDAASVAHWLDLAEQRAGDP
ncbi:MAG: phosphotransferase [Chloroflexi bacterium]|nr:phosphotransferase [Chloroflexota bacterium]